MRWLALAMGLPLAACLQVGTDTGDGNGTTGASGSGGDPVSSLGSAGATSGTRCTTDPQSQITLCEQIANCPGVDVDPGAFPNCGFRLHSSATYDLECWCGDYLCPVGVPASCATASQLLDQQGSSLIVCEQASEGSCPLPGIDGGLGM